MQRNSVTRDVTWSSSVNSSEVDLRAAGAVGLYLPAGFSGAALTVQVNVAPEGQSADWTDLYDDGGSQISITVAADRVHSLPISLFGYPKIRFVSDQSESSTGKLFAMD